MHAMGQSGCCRGPIRGSFFVARTSPLHLDKSQVDDGRNRLSNNKSCFDNIPEYFNYEVILHTCWALEC